MMIILTTVAIQILLKSHQYEKRIKSGRIKFSETIYERQFSKRELEEILSDQMLPRSTVRLISKPPLRIIEKCDLMFDNDLKMLLIEGKRNTEAKYFKLLFTPKFYRTYVEFKGVKLPEPHRKEVSTYEPMWPPYWPYTLLINRFFEAILISKKDFTLTKTVNPAIVIISTRNVKYWINLKNFTLSRLKVFDNKGRLNMDAIISYKRFDVNIWYPEEIFSIYYFYGKSGRRFVGRYKRLKIEKATLNTFIPPKRFTIKIPYGTFVQDNRFDPPLVFIHGRKQLTDEDLFKMAKNRGLIYEPEWDWFSFPPSSMGGYVLAILGFLMVLVSIIMKRKISRQPGGKGT